VSGDEDHWAALMRAANRGDAAAYRTVLGEIAALVRGVVRREAAARGAVVDVEDVVQETLLAIHLKRGTWREDQPLRPWVRAIARNKLVDAMRRRGRRHEVPIEPFAETLATEPPVRHGLGGAVERLIGALPSRQREVVRAVALDGLETREVAARLAMTEGAVRVALHRGIRRLARVIGGTS